MTKHTHDPSRAAKAVIKTLCARGHRALFAGGCVRDLLLNRVPKDYDVVTDAIPHRVREVFPSAKPVGAQFGVMLVRKFGCDVEVATFRSDGRYVDGRHPESVTFGTEKEDALRRDFTINAMFHDPDTDEIIDYAHGRSDLAAKVIRTVGDPNSRFAEDHLRMLRAVRFAARLGFAIAPPTLQAIKTHCRELVSISPERIWMELAAILEDPSRARGWRLLVETGLAEHLAKDFGVDAEGADRVSARLAKLPSAPMAPALPLAAVLADQAVDEVRRICRCLRISNRLTDAAGWLVLTLRQLLDGLDLELADLKNLMAHEEWPHLKLLFRAELERTTGGLADFHRLCERANRVPEDAIAPPPLLDGNQLAKLGVAPGPAFGVILKQVYRAQLNEAVGNVAEATALARRALAVYQKID